MKLIGQFDSPFVRRVGIALRFYAMPFEHLPWSVFRDAELIARYNPLRRVPTLVLDDGRVLTETLVCLDFLDDRVATDHGHSSERLLLTRSGALRSEGLRLSALAGGAADKAVSLAYEREVRESQSKSWVERCTKQVRECLDRLESERALRKSKFLLGERISHADIAMACLYTFVTSAHPGFVTPEQLPALFAHAERCESMSEFSSVFQPFDIPKA
jgi:glutathione S-transferase